jgi:hypothetical protein
MVRVRDVLRRGLMTRLTHADAISCRSMGMTLTISNSSPPSWPDVAAALKAAGFAVGMRLIDGQLALPTEAPPATWRELRVAAVIDGAARMVTIRRATGGIELVTWGNADEPSLRFRDAIAAAFSGAPAATGGGAG